MVVIFIPVRLSKDVDTQLKSFFSAWAAYMSITVHHEKICHIPFLWTILSPTGQPHTGFQSCVVSVHACHPIISRNTMNLTDTVSCWNVKRKVI